MRGVKKSRGIGILLCFFLSGALFAAPKANKSHCEITLISTEKIEFSKIHGATGLKIFPQSAKKISFSKILNMAIRREVGINPHELTSINKFSKHLYRTAKEEVVLITEVFGVSTPGFDGVVLDNEGNPTANYSLKTILESNSKSATPEEFYGRNKKFHNHVLNVTGKAIRKAVLYSDKRHWQVLLKLGYFDSNQEFQLTKDQSGEARFFRQNASRILSLSSKLFDLESGRRPIRIFIDVQSKKADLPSHDEMFLISHWIAQTNGLIESVTLLKGEEVMVITSPTELRR